MKLTDKINFKQPKYMLPLIIYLPLLGTAYFVFDMFDTELAEKKDAGFTAPPKIDGWKEAEGKSPEQGMRIDYIWHWGDINIEESRVLCNGKREPAVSDHYAVMIKTGI